MTRQEISNSGVKLVRDVHVGPFGYEFQMISIIKGFTKIQTAGFTLVFIVQFL